MYKPHLPAQPFRFIIFPTGTPPAAVWSRKSPPVIPDIEDAESRADDVECRVDDVKCRIKDILLDINEAETRLDTLENDFGC